MTKAYKVEWDDYEGHSEIVFADSRNEARSNVQHPRAVDAEYIERRATRAKAFDEYASLGHVTDRGYLDNGWFITCRGCETILDADYEGTHDDDCACERGTARGCGIYYEDKGRLYCSEDCCDSGYAKAGRSKGLARGAALDADAKWPGIKIVWASGISTVNGRRGEPVGAISFTFPGGTRPVDWNRGDTTIRIGADDEQAWQAFAGGAAGA